MANHIHVVQSFGSFLFVVCAEHGIKLNCTGRCQPNGSAQIWRSPLGHAVLAALKLTGLSYRWIKSRIGQQLVRGRKPGDISDLTEYGCCQNNTNPGNGSQLGIKFFEKRSNLLFYCGRLFSVRIAVRICPKNSSTLCLLFRIFGNKF